jgi:outer membrane protein, multidrug efflux system
MYQKLRFFCSDGDKPVFCQSAPLFSDRPSARHKYLAVISTASGLLISGCVTLGPDFTRPKVSWLDAWAARPLEQPAPQLTGPQCVSADQWWRNFNDPVLEKLVAEAQRLNPGVRTAGARILEARALVGIARSGFYPQAQQLTANLLEAGTVRSEGPDIDFASYGTGFNIGWELDFWGKFRRGVEAADYNYLASIARYDDVQVLVASQTASLYSSIRTFELRLRIAKENAALQKRSLEITEELFHSGNDTELDVQQAKALYLSTLASIPELEAAQRQAHNALGVLLGRAPGPLPELAAGAQKIPRVPLGVIVDMPAELLRRRPDVRVAEMQLAAQSALIGVSEAQLYPSIALGGAIGLSATSRNWSAHTLDWGVGPSLVWNVFDHGRLKNQVLVDDARFQQLYEQYQETVLGAAREVDDSAVAFARSSVQIPLLDQSVEAARRSLEIATTQYREGLVDFQRVLDSQKTLFNQQERLVTSRGEVTQSLIALYKAMGGGWQAGRGRTLLDEATRDTMRDRSDWENLLDAPLPPASTKTQLR